MEPLRPIKCADNGRHWANPYVCPVCRGKMVRLDWVDGISNFTGRFKPDYLTSLLTCIDSMDVYFKYPPIESCRPDLGVRHSHDTFFPQQKRTFSPQSIFYPLFLNEDGRIREKRLSKLHCRF